MSGTTTYSSAQLRERDKIIEEKHQQELANLERKVERLRWTNDDTRKQLFDWQNRSQRLVNCLGFNDIHELQGALDTSGCDSSFRDYLAGGQKLESELAKERRDHNNDILKLSAVEEERKELLEKLEQVQAKQREARNETQKQKMELNQLQSRYDALLDVKERAAERYKVDYKKWNEFSKWIFSEEDQTTPALAKKRRRKGSENKNIRNKKAFLQRLGPDYASSNQEGVTLPPPLGGTEPESDKENQNIRFSNFSSRHSAHVTPVSQNNNNGTKSQLASSSISPSSSPTVFLDTASTPSASSTPVPVSFQSITNTIKRPAPDQRQTVQPSEPPKMLSGFNSSDTEEDSQAVEPYPPTFKVPAMPIIIKRPISRVGNRRDLRRNGGSSDTEEDSQAPTFVTFEHPPKSISRHSVINADTSYSHQRKADSSTPIISRDSQLSASNTSNSKEGPPKKVRRVSGCEFSPASSEARKPDATDATPIFQRVGHQGKKTYGGLSKGEGKIVQEDLITPKPHKTIGQMHFGDYSAFKGRGRYACKNTNGPERTINSVFTIDPAQNNGMNYQYDEVVRGKERRKHMDAGDCECCRDYYEGVGPLPDRLQQPLWRSPSRHHPSRNSDPVEDNPGSSHTHHRSHAIDNHKKAISRHRHTWARAKTPPSYWNIGFPDTQEVGAINKKAEEMHRKKQDEVARMADREDGRYQKR